MQAPRDRRPSPTTGARGLSQGTKPGKRPGVEWSVPELTSHVETRHEPIPAAVRRLRARPGRPRRRQRHPAGRPRRRARRAFLALRHPRPRLQPGGHGRGRPRQRSLGHRREHDRRQGWRSDRRQDHVGERAGPDLHLPRLGTSDRLPAGGAEQQVAVPRHPGGGRRRPLRRWLGEERPRAGPAQGRDPLRRDGFRGLGQPPGRHPRGPEGGHSPRGGRRAGHECERRAASRLRGRGGRGLGNAGRALRRHRVGCGLGARRRRPGVGGHRFRCGLPSWTSRARSSRSTPAPGR